MPHPYDEKDRRDPGAGRSYPDLSSLDSVVDRAVEFGTRMGSEVLTSIATALQDSLDKKAASPAPPKPEQEFRRYCRRLDGKLGNSFLGWLMAGITGWFFVFCFLVACIVMVSLAAAGPQAPGLLWEYRTVFEILAAVFAPLTAGSTVLGCLGVSHASYFARLRRYLKCMRGWTGTLAQLARDAVVPPQKARKDLQKAAASGHLGAACYDADGDVLYLDGSQYRPAAPPPAAGEPTDAGRFRQQGADFLAYLRSCRGRLAPDADAELEAMQRICGAIMGFVHNHPEQLPRVRRFAEYYLPTTRKLLDTALGLGDNMGENAQIIRRDITGILHTLNTAYSKLYDTLLQDVSLDISAEIDTLETMLSQDGLTRDFASDFGTASH